VIAGFLFSIAFLKYAIGRLWLSVTFLKNVIERLFLLVTFLKNVTAGGKNDEICSQISSIKALDL